MADRLARAARQALTKLRLLGFAGRRVYFQHLLGLVQPGRRVLVPAAHQVQPSSLDTWSDDDLKLMIDEGRRQLDRQFSDLEHIRSRAQWLFTIGVAVLAAMVSSLSSYRPTIIGWILWLLAVTLVLCGTAGAAAIMVIRADFSTIDTATLSQRQPPIQKGLASDYSTMLKTGEDSVAARISVFHEAVLYLISGGILGLLVVLAHL